jgi:hypothetical protein
MAKLRLYVAICTSLAILGLINPAFADDSQPKSNAFARAQVLSKNELSITIRHSDWGQKAGYQFAADHCASYERVAIQATSGKGYGPDTTTTWMCQQVPQAVPTVPSDAPKAPRSDLAQPRF